MANTRGPLNIAFGSYFLDSFGLVAQIVFEVGFHGFHV